MTHNIWRLLIDAPADGATNMARDEAIAAAHAAGAAPATLRLYRWRPACLSLGRFQRSDVIDRDACERAGITVVRRPSGGRALLHDDELTYAVIGAAGHPPFDGAGSILAAYRQISLALLAGLRRLGLQAELTPVTRRDRLRDNETRRQRDKETTRQGGIADADLLVSPSPGLVVSRSAACFDTAAAYELMVAGRKLAGSAQMRRQGVLLQHGALPLTPHAERLAALLVAPPPNLGAKMIALDEALGRLIGFEEVASAIAGGFAESWDITFEPGKLTAAEQVLVERLREEKYLNASWTYLV